MWDFNFEFVALAIFWYIACSLMTETSTLHFERL